MTTIFHKIALILDVKLKQNMVFMRGTAAVLCLVLFNFSIYLAEINVIRELHSNKRYCEQLIKLFSQSAEEEQKHSSVDELKIEFFTTSHSYESNLFVLKTERNNQDHISDFFASCSLDISTPPPEA